MKTVLLTGGTGYLGAHLAKRMLRTGWDVHLLVRPGSKPYLNDFPLGKNRIHIHDSTQATAKSLIQTLESIQPESVFHLATKYVGQHQTGDLEGLIQSNILFGAQLCEAMSITGVQNLINVGTGWQHYNGELYNPVALYGATKEAFANIVRYYTENKSLRAVHLKLFDTYGPQDNRPKLFSILRGAIQTRTPLPMSPGEQFMDLVYVDDVIDGFLEGESLFIKSKIKEQSYALSSGSPVRVREVVETYFKVLGSRVQVNWGAHPYRPREMMEPWQAGPCLPNWTPKVPLEEGIRKMEGISA